MTHLTQEQLSARLDDALAPAQVAEVDRHLAECESCRAALASLAAQDDALGRVLEHDPGDAYFESFAARVEDRIRAAGLRGAQARVWEGGIFSWLRSPRRLAVAGVVAAVIGGLGVVIVTARMERPERALLESRPVARAIAPQETPKEKALDQERALGEKGAQSSVALKDDKTGGAPAAPAPVAPSLAKRSESIDAQTDELRQAPPEASAPERATPNATQGRARAAPRTDADAGTSARPQPTSGFAQPPAEPGGTLATRKAAPANERPTLAREESKLQNYASPSPSASGQAAGVQLCGRVVNAQGRPVAGAVVALADLGMTVQTDAQGGFCFAAPAGTHSLSVFAVGYQQSRVDARAGTDSALEIKLRPVQVLEGPLATNPSLDTEADVARAFAGAPARVRDGVSAAQALYARAKASGAAADYDTAAARWQKLVPGRTGAALQEGRFRLAEARYQAWQAGPTPARARAATDALIAYLRYADSGAKRDQAASWLTRVLR